MPRSGPARLLVCDSGVRMVDWVSLFKGQKLQDGRPIEVEIRPYNKISVCVYAETGALVELAPFDNKPFSFASQNVRKSFAPDFVLSRSMLFTPQEDYRSQALGLIYAQLPSVNNLQAELLLSNKPYMLALLKATQAVLGKENFPLLPTDYYQQPSDVIVHPEFPFVVKVGSFHAGVGKCLVDNERQLEDTKSMLSCFKNPPYLTCEPFVQNSAYEIRLQKIGPHVRAEKRKIYNGWKSNTTSAVEMTPMEVSDRHRRMIDTAAQVAGNLSICSLDLIADQTGTTEYVLELNGSASGILARDFDEDNARIVSLVVAHMNHYLCQPPSLTPSSTKTPTSSSSSSSSSSSASSSSPSSISTTTSTTTITATTTPTSNTSALSSPAPVTMLESKFDLIATNRQLRNFFSLALGRTVTDAEFLRFWSQLPFVQQEEVALEIDRQRQLQLLPSLTDEQALTFLRSLHIANPTSLPSRLLQLFVNTSSPPPSGLVPFSAIIARFINSHSASVMVDEAYAAPLAEQFGAELKEIFSTERCKAATQEWTEAAVQYLSALDQQAHNKFLVRFATSVKAYAVANPPVRVHVSGSPPEEGDEGEDDRCVLS